MASNHQSRPLYSTLTTPRSIRLLKKLKQTGPIVRLVMSTASLEDPPKYTALSYTWGSANIGDGLTAKHSCPIICNEQLLYVTRNLYDALCILVTDDESSLWIDAISINQADTPERSAQVAMMGSIYAKAQGTFIWLGDEDLSAKMAINAIERFVLALSIKVVGEGKATYNVGIKDPAFWGSLGIEMWSDEEINAMANFFTRAWFERTWIIQEIAVAANVLVVCGGLTLWWDKLWTFSIFLWESGWHHELQRLQAISRGKRISPGAYEDASLGRPLHLNPMSLQKLRDACRSGVPVSADLPAVKLEDIGLGEGTEKLFYTSLQFFIQFGRTYKATQPVDKIFAPVALLLHLFSSRSLRGFSVIDYSKAVTDVYLEITSAIILNTQQLSTLSAVEDVSFREYVTMPSWVPDYSVFCVSPLSYLTRPRFDATAGWLAQSTPSISGYDLSVTGQFFDFIAIIGPSHVGLDGIPMVVDPTPWLECCLALPQPYPNQQHRAEAFMHTLICGQNKLGMTENLSSRFRAFLTYEHASLVEIPDLQAGTLKFPVLDKFEETDPNEWIPTTRDILDLFQSVLNDNLENKDFIGESEEFFTRLHLQTITGRRLFVTHKGYIGLGPMSAEVGDWIVLLPGSKIPFCIRGSKQPRVFVADGMSGASNPQGVRNDSYALVGEAYVQGIMSGELFKTDVNAATEPIVLR